MLFIGQVVFLPQLITDGYLNRKNQHFFRKIVSTATESTKIVQTWWKFQEIGPKYSWRSCKRFRKIHEFVSAPELIFQSQSNCRNCNYRAKKSWSFNHFKKWKKRVKSILMCLFMWCLCDFIFDVISSYLDP